ncbi:MAG: hypothetical protein EKK49_08825 [Rhodocyclaceae bacterium]|nr:MAG: hypothetical protein EKK49_08825 [Rhodocyclaceae bacterium]
MNTTTGFEPIPMNDVECCLNSCAESFAQLAALLQVIKDKAPEYSDAARLAALGWSVACDMENFAGSTLEQVQKGGVKS